MRIAPHLWAANVASDSPEGEAIRDIQGNLISLGMYIHSLKSAIALFEFCRPHTGKAGADPFVVEWQFIAARDGAMSIYHFGKVWQVIPALVRRSPTMTSLIDTAELKAVGKAFETGFPNWAAVRKGVAHMGDFSKDAGNFADHAFTGNIGQIPGYDGGGEHIYMSNNLSGSTYFSTVDGKIVSYDVAMETADRLAVVRDMIWGIFDAVSETLEAQAKAAHLAEREKRKQPDPD